MSRREQLEEMLAESPEDTFLRYALAMELKSAEEYDACIKLFQELMKDVPPHVPAFFMAGQALAADDRVEEAQAVLTTGIEQAQAQGDTHAAGEMTQFLASLE
jgi:cytochrome c-type biogenesis protein CcmH/NrfG